MDWFLYDKDIRHERAKDQHLTLVILEMFFVPVLLILSSKNAEGYL